MEAGVTYEPVLVAVSVGVSVIASYAALDLTDRVRVAKRRRALWAGAGAVAMGTGIWAVQFDGLLAMHSPLKVHYAPLFLVLALLVAIAAAAAMLLIAGTTGERTPVRVIGGSLAFATGLSVTEALSTLAMRTGTPLFFDPMLLLLSFGLGLAGSFVAILVAFALRTMSGESRGTFRVVGAVIFGLAIAATHFTGSQAMHPLRYGTGTAGDLDDGEHDLAVSLSLLLGAILLAFVDRRLHRERARLVELRERFSREVQLALTLQRSLLPTTLPDFPGLRLSASYAPATHHYTVGGDFYDAFPLEDGTLAVVIGDAAGHGLPASVAMNVARQAFRSAFLDGSRPVEALRRANRVLLRSDKPGLVTALVGTIEPQTLVFRYACAGHPTPLLARADGTWSELPGMGSGIPLGILEEHIATEHAVALPIDGLLAFYTDGCVEFDRDIVSGTEALAAALLGAYANDPERPAIAIDRTLFGEREHDDDATILTLRADPAIERISLRLPAEPASAPLVRTAMRRFLAASRLSEHRAYDGLVAVGEAVSNAIEHAYGGPSHETFAVTAERIGETLVVSISDYGQWRGPLPWSVRGRGLHLMQQLSDDLDVTGGAEGTRVTMRFEEAIVLPDVALAPASSSHGGA